MSTRLETDRMNFRRWAVLLTLYEWKCLPGGRWMTTSILTSRVQRDGWEIFPPWSERVACIRRALQSMNGDGRTWSFVEGTLIGAEFHWQLTEEGVFYVEHFLADNPHVTPEESRRTLAA